MKSPEKTSVRPIENQTRIEPKKQTCILVLGMHRSGTSALARILNLAGARLPKKLMGAGTGNERGHWEPEALAAYHDRLLDRLDSSWHDWQGPDFSKLAPGESTAIRREIGAIIDEDFGSSPLFVLKEPRICRLAPFVIGALEDMKIDIVPVLAMRNPVDVAASLMRRDAIWPEEYTGFDAYMLWLRHVLDAERATRGMRRCFISYETLMADWRKIFSSLEDQAGLTFAKTPKAIAPLVEEFLSPQMRHHASRLEDVALRPELQGLVSEAWAAYRLLEGEPDNVSAIGELDDTRNNLMQILPAAAYFVRESRLALKMERVNGNRLSEELKAEREGRSALGEELKAERESRSALGEELKAERESRSALGEELKAERESRSALGLAFEASKNEVSNLHRELNFSVNAHKQEFGRIHKSWAWRYGAPLRALERLARKKQERLDRELILASKLFDMDWYLERNPDVKGLGIDPALHYLRYGAYEGRHPSVAFDTVFYLTHHFDVMNAGINPLVHYLRFGERENRTTMPIKEELLDEGVDFQPFVSIIVPNYNHEAYLDRRLSSIYSQKYSNYEVIILDDCSSDGSSRILSDYQRRYADKTRYLQNDENSGSGYKQWAKGLSLASGELIWIAESDDWSDPDFLQRLVPAFVDEALMIAYSNSSFVDEKGIKEIWTTDAYVNDLDDTLWKNSFKISGHGLVNKGWSNKNIIPNVSSAVFRHPGKDNSLMKGEWSNMKICGDWLLYLNISKGGDVYYTPEKLNFYRVHQGSTAKSTFSKDVYYKEHEQIASFVMDNYNVPPEFTTRLEGRLETHWKQCRTDFSKSGFASCYDQKRIRSCAGKRKPNILMCGYALVAGGGETFPIFLANILKERGYAVTFLSFEQAPKEDGVRSLLRADIPVLYDWRNVARIVEEMGIDIVHSHHAWVEGILFDSMPPQSRAEIVVTMHGMYESLPEEVQKRIIPRLLDRSAQIIYVAKKNIAPFLNYVSEDKLTFIRNALPDIKINHIDRSSLGIDDDSFVLTVVSRAIKQKGWEESIQVVKSLRDNYGRKVDLLLIGSGPEVERLKEKALPEFVHLMGFQSRPRDYYAISNLGMLLTTFPGESYPLTLIDCLMSGVPVIASSLGEIPDMIVEEGSAAGISVDLIDGAIPVDDVCRRIDALISEGKEYDAMLSNISIVASKFRFENMVDSYVDVYRRALSR